MILNTALTISLLSLLIITLRENLITKTEEEKKKRKEKISQKIHTFLSGMTLIFILKKSTSELDSYLLTLVTSLYLFAILANTSFFLSFIMSPLTSYYWLKDRILDLVIIFNERKSLEEFSTSFSKEDLKAAGLKYANFLKEKRKTYKENKSDKNEREYFKTSFLISRETFFLSLLLTTTSNSELLKSAIENYGLVSITWFLIALTWSIFILAILRGIWGHIKLSSIANKIGETKQSFDSFLKQVPPMVDMVVKLVFNIAIFSLVRKYEAPSVVKTKVEKFFSGSDSIFEYLLNAIRLYPLIKTLTSFMFRFFVVSAITACLVKTSLSTEASVLDIAFDISGIFFGASDLSFHPNDSLLILIKNLHIISWISQFALFSLLATTFSISITQLSDKTRMFYDHYKKPINDEILKAIYKVNSRQLKRAKDKILKNLDKSALTPDARKNLEELEEKLLEALD